MPLAEAEQALSDAWHHGRCPDGHLHLFLFGSHDISRAGTLLLETEPRDSVEAVTAIYGVEHYQLVLYSRCTSLDLSSAKGPLWR